MATFPIRTFGDPVLKRRAEEVPESEWGSLRRLADDMLDTMYRAPGVGLAAPQVGVQKRFFVYDVGDGPGAVINPEIVETDGVWSYEEGCLSVPGLFFPLERPMRVHLRGFDLNGREIEVEADQLLARMFLHETDHLDGYLVVDRLDPETRKQALKVLRHRAMGIPVGDLPEGIHDRRSIRRED